MILRKPYAILIKYFKLIHLILGILIGYMIYRTSLMMTFINDYMSSVQTVIKSQTVSDLFGNIFILVILLIIILSLIIMALMNFKNKPIKFYLFNIITYLFASSVFIFGYSIISRLEIGLVDIRTLKLVQDLITSVMIFQVISFIIVIIRATGFDIKSFNFKEDIEELNIEGKDNEEFELDLEIDSDIIKRKFNRRIRHAKYIYIENKLFINIVALIIIIVSFIFGYFNINFYNKTYQKNEVFKTIEYILNIKDSYITSSDYNNNEISDNEKLVVIRFKIRKTSNLIKKLNTGRFTLDIDKRKYYHTREYEEKLIDLGDTYNSELISSNFKNYILVFKVPKKLDYKKITLRYFDINHETIKINITPINLDKEKQATKKNINEEILFSESILKNTSLKINNYEISDTFKVNYKYCINTECYDSYEYLKPILNSNDEKTLLKINGEVKLDNSIWISYIDIPSLFKYFTSIKCIINNETIFIKSNFNNIVPKKIENLNEYYLEVPSRIKEASKIDLIFNIRNNIYTYNLK